MSLHLERENYYVITGLLAVSLLSGFLIDLLQRNAVISVHDATFYLPGPALLVGAIFIYLARDNYGGVMARNMEVVGTGLTILGVTWVAFAGFFAAGFPAWGVTPAFWTVLLALLVTTSFLIVAYGFYLFWKLGREVEFGGGPE